MIKKSATDNKKLALIILGVVFGMLLGSFASVPLYNLFCRVTGFGGTPKRVTEPIQNPEYLLNQKPITEVAVQNFQPIKIFFDQTIENVPISAAPNPKVITTKLNQEQRIIYHITNLSDKTITITSTYNATPLKYARWINKTECFCFTEHTLKPKEEVDFPIVLYLDKGLINAEGSNKLRELTLGYHFYLTPKQPLQ